MFEKFFYANGFAKGYAEVMSKGNPKGYKSAYREAKLYLIKEMLEEKPCKWSIQDIADIHTVSYMYVRKVYTRMLEEKKKQEIERIKYQGKMEEKLMSIKMMLADKSLNLTTRNIAKIQRVDLSYIEKIRKEMDIKSPRRKK